MNVSPSVLERTSDSVTLTWSGVENPGQMDWIGLWDTTNSTYLMYIYAYTDTSASVLATGHRDRRLSGPGVDPDSLWEVLEFRSDFTSGNGSFTFSLPNLRFNYTFFYYKAGTTHLDPPLALSPPVSFLMGVDEPTQPRLSLTTVPGQLHLTWISAFPGDPATVRFGPSADSLKFTATGASHTYTQSDLCAVNPDTQWIDPGSIHDVTLDLAGMGFKSGQPVFYSFGSNGLWSDVHNTTVPATDTGSGGESDAPWSFLMYADQGTEQQFACAKCQFHETQRYGPGSHLLMDRIADNELASSNPPHFVLHVGDLGYARNTAWVWDIFGDTIRPVSSRIPIQVSVGNHEYDHTSGGENGKDPSGVTTAAGYHPSWGNQGDDSNGECGVPTFHRFRAPATGNAIFWYSIAYKNAFVILLSAEHSLEAGAPQRVWLESTLASVDRSQFPWLVMGAHRPLYMTETSGKDTEVGQHMQEEIGDLLQQYSVDMFLAGHYHAYERTAPVYNGTVRGTPEEVDATTHVTVGTAGIAYGVNEWMPESWSLKHYHAVFAYSRLTIASDNDMLFELVAVNGTLLDSVKIHSGHNFTKPAAIM